METKKLYHFTSNVMLHLRTAIFIILILNPFSIANEIKSRKSNSRMPYIQESSANRNSRSKRAINVNLSAENITELLWIHNHYRRLEPASNMEKLVWNQALAEMAQQWADRCIWGHGNYEHQNNKFGQYVGQNIYAGRPFTNLSLSIWEFYREKEFFNFDTLECYKAPCGHYTQVVWASTREMGCGIADRCDGIFQNGGHGKFLVCNYGYSGNWGGEQPYWKGAQCSQCESGKSWCDNGLCVDSCSSSNPNCTCQAACQNCGTYVAEDCSCNCPAGWGTTDCSEPCQNYDDTCVIPPGGTGWPVSWCQDNSFSFHVYRRCHKLCGRCQPTPDGGAPQQGNCRADGPGASSSPATTPSEDITQDVAMTTVESTNTTSGTNHKLSYTIPYLVLTLIINVT